MCESQNSQAQCDHNAKPAANGRRDFLKLTVLGGRSAFTRWRTPPSLGPQQPMRWFSAAWIIG